VVLGARRLDRCEATAERIRGEGGEAVAVPLDLTDAVSVEQFAKAAEAHLGPIEVLVSNAGDVLPRTTVETDPDEFARQVTVNLLGAQRLLHHLVPPMVERRRGDVVVVTSEVSQRPRPRMAAYVTSKWGLEGMVEALRLELEGTGVRAGMVRPGPSATEQGSNWDPADVDRAIEAWTRFGLMRHAGYLRPRDVATAIVAMVSVPRGTSFAVIEVQPEAPVAPAPDTDPAER
jgi:NADP-dependent 3-hydroxy acid dehydrogenase YdfG